MNLVVFQGIPEFKISLSKKISFLPSCIWCNIFPIFPPLELNALLSMDMVLQNLIQSIIVLVSMPILWIFSFELRRSWLWVVIEESKMDRLELEDKRYQKMYVYLLLCKSKIHPCNLTFKSLFLQIDLMTEFKKDNCICLSE